MAEHIQKKLAKKKRIAKPQKPKIEIFGGDPVPPLLPIGSTTARIVRTLRSISATDKLNKRLAASPPGTTSKTKDEFPKGSPKPTTVAKESTSKPKKTTKKKATSRPFMGAMDRPRKKKK